MKHQYTLITGGILLLLFSKCCLANTNDIRKLSELSMSEILNMNIYTASKAEESVKDTPVTTLVITQQQIDERGYRTLLDLFKDLPGVDIQAFNHQVQYHTVAFRGHVGSHKLLILQDGVRINSPTGEPIPIAENFPIQHAKQVEIVYGPASALYGADAFGGVINIVTDKKPEQQSLTLGFGNDDYYYHQFQAGGQLHDDLSINIAGHKHRSDYSNFADDYKSDFQLGDLNTLSGNLYLPANQRESYSAKVKSESLFARLGYKDWLSFGFNHSFIRTPSTIGELPNITQYGADAQWNTEINNLYLRLNYPVTGQIKAETLIDYNEYEVDPKSKFKNIFVDYLDAFIYVKGERKSIEQQFNWTLNEQHKLIAGFSYEDFYSLPKTTDLPFPYDEDSSPNSQNMFHIGTNNTLPIEFFELDYNNRAFYLQWQTQWNDKLSTIMGIRYDDNSRYDETINPRIGLVYKPDNKSIFKVFYGEAYRAPSPQDSYEVFGIFSGLQNSQGDYLSFFFNTPNPDLEPEEIRSIEWNYVYAFNPKTHLSLSGFYTETDELILRVPEQTPTQFINGGQILSAQHSENFGSGKLYGIELAASYETNVSQKINVKFWGNYSYIDGNNKQKDSSDKTQLQYVSPHKLKLGTTIYYGERWIITPKLYLIGQINNGRTDSSENETPGYGIMDVHASYKLSKKLRVKLDIYNLFDRKYYSGGIHSRNNFQDVPQPLRQGIISMQYTL